VGVPHHGVLTDAVELPRRGDGFTRYRAFGKSHWGTEPLVRAVERAARLVEEQHPGGAPLVLGDLSAKQGGKVPRHNSHRTGRDIDLLWYVTTPSGAPVKNPGFVQIEEDGLAVVPGTDDYVMLDVPRMWTLLRILLTSPDVGVQWMFCSRPIEALLIDHARARGEPDEVVWRAETVLLQPGDSLAHDDHIHLRIACSPEEMISGCQGGGPYWQWLPPIPKFAEDDEWLYAALGADPLEETNAPTAESDEKSASNDEASAAPTGHLR
jgi:penicillin-insensitive murein endopeptidase